MLKLSDDEFIRLVTFIQSNYGIDLHKKRVLIEGRLTNEVQAKGFTDYTSYFNTVLSNPKSEDAVKLINKLTTNHTFFMREPEHFDYLKATVLPWIEQNVRDKDARIWCAAASTGQEPYTLAMVIDDYFGTRKAGWDTTILATDISTEVLDKARAGIYTYDMIQDLPPAWIQKYFRKLDAERYQVTDYLRKQVVYKQFNLMDKIVYKKPFDLISCRNVMIYFDGPTKKALIDRLYDATKPGGFFFIGHAENVSKETRYQFIKPAIYRKKP